MAVTRKAHSPSGETLRSNFGALSAPEYRATCDRQTLAATLFESADPFRKRALASDIFGIDCVSHRHSRPERAAYISGYYHHAPCPQQCERWPPDVADRLQSQPHYPSSHCSQVGYARSFAPRGPFVLQLPGTSVSATTKVPQVAPQYSCAASQAGLRPKLPSSTRKASPPETHASPWSPGASFRNAPPPPAPLLKTTISTSFAGNLTTAGRNAAPGHASSAHVDTAASLEATAKVVMYESQSPRQLPASLTSHPATKKRIRHAPFPKKLYEIVMANPGVVTWHEESRALIVRDPRRLSAEIMPRYFNTNGGDGILKSFTRQLNYYGFHRVSLHLPKSSASLLSLAQPSKERGAIEDQSPFLLLKLRGSQIAACEKAGRLLTGRYNWSHDTPVHFFRNYFGIEALVFVNKDRTIKGPADFNRLIRFEKAASRIALHAR